jgi:RNA polymerase sigma-70 factor (ECF subfamily)
MPKITETSLGELYDRHAPALLRYAESLTHNQWSAEDLVQDAFLRANGAEATFSGPSSQAAWLRQIVKHLFLDETRRAKIVHTEPLASESPGYATSVENWPDFELHDFARATLARLPLKQRQVLELSLAGFRGPEIAKHLDLTPGYIRVLAHRARQTNRQAQNRKETTMIEEPYLPGDTVVRFHQLYGQFGEPLVVLKAPTKRGRLTLVRYPDVATQKIDALELWRDNESVRQMAALRAEAWRLTKEFANLPANERQKPESPAYQAAVKAMISAKMTERQFRAEMSKHHPYRTTFRRGSLTLNGRLSPQKETIDAKPELQNLRFEFLPLAGYIQQRLGMGNDLAQLLREISVLEPPDWPLRTALKAALATKQPLASSLLAEAQKTSFESLQSLLILLAQALSQPDHFITQQALGTYRNEHLKLFYRYRNDWVG